MRHRDRHNFLNGNPDKDIETSDRKGKRRNRSDQALPEVEEGREGIGTKKENRKQAKAQRRAIILAILAILKILTIIAITANGAQKNNICKKIKD